MLTEFFYLILIALVKSVIAPADMGFSVWRLYISVHYLASGQIA